MTETNICFRLFQSVRGKWGVYRNSIIDGIPSQTLMKTFSNSTIARAYMHKMEEGLDSSNRIGSAGPLQQNKTEVENMPEKVLKAGITREKGWLYYIDKAGDISRAKIGKDKKKGN